MFAEFLVTVSIVGLSLYLHSKRSDPGKVLGIYAQPGKWYYLKYAAFWTLLWVRRLKTKLFKPPTNYDLEGMKSLSEDDKAFDAVFFHAVNAAGFYLCGGVERRHGAKANALIYLVVPELGLLENPNLPKTSMDIAPETILKFRKYCAGGLSFGAVEPMKTWKLCYKGRMKLHNDPARTVQVELTTEWTSDMPYFLFELDMSANCLSRAMAREQWSKQFFQSLKDAHQSHYEQMGYLSGTLNVDGKEYKVEMDSFRDHSYGHKRDWSLMHRYAFHMFYLEDNTRVSVGVVSQPCTTSHLEMGYVVLPDKTINPIKSCDLILYQHGENGSPAKNYGFSFTTNDQDYSVSVDVIYESVHYKGDDIEARLIERFVECEVNGIKGRGISEWHYNNMTDIIKN